eukprot:361525-Chlamydomonas_euryale.AAC.14
MDEARHAADVVVSWPRCPALLCRKHPLASGALPLPGTLPSVPNSAGASAAASPSMSEMQHPNSRTEGAPASRARAADTPGLAWGSRRNLSGQQLASNLPQQHACFHPSSSFLLL